MAAIVDVLHIHMVIFDIYDFVVLVRWTGAVFMRTLDIVHPWKTWIILQVLVHILGVLRIVIDLVVIDNTNAFCVFIFFGKATTLAVEYEMLFFIDVHIQHVVTLITEFHGIEGFTITVDYLFKCV